MGELSRSYRAGEELRRSCAGRAEEEFGSDWGGGGANGELRRS